MPLSPQNDYKKEKKSHSDYKKNSHSDEDSCINILKVFYQILLFFFNFFSKNP